MFTDPQMEEYFSSLPAETQNFIIRSGVEIATLGELMQIGEHFKKDI